MYENKTEEKFPLPSKQILLLHSGLVFAISVSHLPSKLYYLNFESNMLGCL